MRTSCTRSFCKARCNPISKRLQGLTIGALTLDPEFDPDTTAYAVTTSNASNKVTATPESSDATVVVKLGTTEIENGSSATWTEGENTLTVKVTGDDGSTTYTVTVTAE